MGQASGGDILDLQLGLRDAAANYRGDITPPIPVSAAALRGDVTPTVAPSFAPQAQPSVTAQEPTAEEAPKAEAKTEPGVLDRLKEGITKDPLKALIAALGLGGMAFQYNRAQGQAKDVANQLRQAYGQASAETRALAQPYMQQGGQQLGQAIAGQLTAANQQQLEAARAQAAQQVARSGGVATAQAQRSIEDARQRLLQNQTNAAIALLGAGTPLISSAIQQQLQGTTTGIQTGLNLSQQSGQAASNLVTQLALLYGRSGK